VCNPACLAFGTDQLGPADVAGRDVVEVGALDVNGSLRPAVERLGPRSYAGVDICPGPGVDIVCDAHRLLDVLGPHRCDVLIATELIEHVRDWRLVVHNLKGLLRPGGVLLLTTRSPGFGYHGFPEDFWRYEVDDLRRIFGDFAIEAIEPDPSSPGVFLKARKPADFRERDLAEEALVSVVTGRRTRTLTDRRLSAFRLQRRARRLLGRALRALAPRRHGPPPPGTPPRSPAPPAPT
jgi:SAM-dependent methyltransferase